MTRKHKNHLGFIKEKRKINKCVYCGSTENVKMELTKNSIFFKMFTPEREPRCSKCNNKFFDELWRRQLQKRY